VVSSVGSSVGSGCSGSRSPKLWNEAVPDVPVPGLDGGLENGGTVVVLPTR
jgi:hypothetical protein